MKLDIVVCFSIRYYRDDILGKRHLLVMSIDPKTLVETYLIQKEIETFLH